MEETDKIWISLFTPQIGETSYEIIPREARPQLVRELLELRAQFPKLNMQKGLIENYLNTPSDPSKCIFARTTRTVTADLQKLVTPCQFGGNPDCSQCGCIASAGLNALGNHRLPGGLRVGWIYEKSLQIGERVAAMRG